MPEKPPVPVENVVNQQASELLKETQQLAAINDNLTQMAGLYVEKWPNNGSRSQNYIVKYKGQKVWETSVWFMQTEWALLNSMAQNKSLQLPETVKERVKNLQTMFGTMQRLSHTLDLQAGFEKWVWAIRDVKWEFNISVSTDGGSTYNSIDTQKSQLRLTDLVSMEVVKQDALSTIVKTVDLKWEEGYIQIKPKSTPK